VLLLDVDGDGRADNTSIVIVGDLPLDGSGLVL
jgi:hypothetical protein